MRMLSRRALTECFLGTLLSIASRRANSLDSQMRPGLVDSTRLRGLQLPNRMIMAPMTRGRAGAQRTANSLMADYYSQRAAAGLIVTEGTAISPQGYGWMGSPAIYTDAHVAGWKGVTEAVHRRGGRIFLQLWHTGRVSHPDFQDGETPIGPSAIAAAGDTHTPSGEKPYVIPRAMARRDIANAVGEYAQAAERAWAAGFDGVEIHAANGYLIDQFIRDGSNHRTDAYGGSVQKRLRFLLEVTEAVARRVPVDRIGVRLSPTNSYNDMLDRDPAATFTQAAKELNRFGLAYLHVVETVAKDSSATQMRIAPRMRAAFDGPLILNGGYDATTGAAALAAGEADLIAYGRHFLANPDLVERFRRAAPLNQPDTSTFYTDGPKGYTDYAPLDKEARATAGQ
jgi:N-ethylmaleimide reductase